MALRRLSLSMDALDVGQHGQREDGRHTGKGEGACDALSGREEQAQADNPIAYAELSDLHVHISSMRFRHRSDRGRCTRGI